MFQATLEREGKAKLFAQFVSGLADLWPHGQGNVCFEFGNSSSSITEWWRGIKTVIMNEPHTCLINCTYKSSAFDVFTCPNNFRFGVGLHALDKALASIRTNKATLRLEISDEEPQYLVVYINGDKKFRCENTQVPARHFDIPDIDQRKTATADVQPKFFMKMLNQMSFYDNKHVDVTTSVNHMVFSLTNEQTNDSMVFKHKLEGIHLGFRGIYSVKAMANVFRLAGIDSWCKVMCINGEKEPEELRIKWSNQYSSGTAYIAPILYET